MPGSKSGVSDLSTCLQQSSTEQYHHFLPRLAVCAVPSYNTPPCEAPMPFSVRPDRRFPLCCPVTYHAGLFEGQGIVWNLSVNGWRLSGDVPLRVGQTCPLTV